MGRELTSKEETAGIREKHTYGGKVSYPSDALGPRLKALLEKIKKLKQNKLSLSIYSDHIVVSKHLFSRKKKQGFLENWLFPGLEQETYKRSPEHLVPEAKKAIKHHRSHVKRTQVPT